jgi:hypothetical protein
MKLLGRDGDGLVFGLTAREGEALRFVLGRYPALDPAYHQITRPEAAADLREEQRLLTEAMAETQAANRRRVAEFLQRNLAPAGASAEGRAVLRLSLTDTEADWFLEVLNNVRVGLWVKLGRPLPGRDFLQRPDSQTLADYSALEIAGHLQSTVLEALQS